MKRLPLVIAHRGASGYRPEHSRAAVALALELGADAIEPDLVPTKDGVLVLRHENEISGTTDVADRREFRDRRTTKHVDGVKLTGWFTEDFTWDELSTLRVRERLPTIRRDSHGYDDAEPMLSFGDLLDLLDEAAEIGPRPVLVSELKHATYFESIGLPLAVPYAAAVRDRVPPESHMVEAFEKTVLDQVREAGVDASVTYLLERNGTAPDEQARTGAAAPTYTDELDDLEGLARRVDAISVERSRLLRYDRAGNAIGTTDLVDRAHAVGLDVYCWTLRAENRFLAPNHRRGEPHEYGDWQSEFGLILSTGLDGVFADQPDLVRALVEKRPAPGHGRRPGGDIGGTT